MIKFGMDPSPGQAAADVAKAYLAAVEGKQQGQVLDSRLVEHGRDRDRRAAQPMPRQAHRQPTTPSRRNRRLGRQRNASQARIKWMFTTEQARAKMGRAYPQSKSHNPCAELLGRRR
jgi:hypothetical protein